MVADNTGNILVYFGSSFTQDFNIGDVVVVEGSKATHNKGAEITSPTVTASTETIDLTEETPKELTAADLDAYASSTVVTVELVKLTGKLTISDNKYYNVAIDGTSKQGSIAYPLTGLVDSSLNGKYVDVYGYVFSISGTNYVNILATNVEESTVIPPVETLTVSEIIALSDNTSVKLVAKVVAVYANGYMVADNTGKILVYFSSFTQDFNIGDVVVVEGSKATHNKGAEITSPTVTASTETIDLTEETPKELTAADLDAYASSTVVTVELVKLTGKLTISDNKYYNVAIDGTSKQGSIAYPLTGLVDSNLNGKNVVVTGYVFSISGTNYINIMALSVAEVELTDAEKVAEALAKVSAPETATEDFTLVEVEGVVWSLKAESVAATLAGNTVKVTRQSTDTDIVLVATATFGEVTDSKEFIVTVLAEGTVVTEKTLTIDFSTATGKGSTVSSNALSFIEGYASEKIIKSAKATKVYNGNSSGGKYGASAGLIRLGTSGANGILTLTFNEGIKVSKVILNCYSWTDSTNDKVTVGDSTVALPNGDAAEDLEFTLDGVNEFTITSVKRMFLFSITVIYSDGSSETPELTDAEKVEEALAKVSAPATATEDFTLDEVEGVVWSLKAESVAATLAGNTVKVTRQSTDTDIVLVATATFGEVTDSKEFIVTVLGDGSSSGEENTETYTYTLEKGVLTTSGGEVTFGSVSWTSSAATYVGYDGTKGVQIGSKNKPTNSFTLTTSGIAGTIKSIKINASMAAGGSAKLNVSVGGTKHETTQALEENAKDYEFKINNLSGEIIIELTTSAKAMYIKSITIEYVK